MSIKAVGGNSIATGAGALAAIDVTDISVGSVGLVVLTDDTDYGDSIVLYVLKNSGDTELLPRIILPTSGTVGNKRWHMASVFNMAGVLDAESKSSYQLAHDLNAPLAFLGNRAIKAYADSENQWIVGQRVFTVSIPFISPHLWNTSVRSQWNAWYNESGFDFIISRVFCLASSEIDLTLNEITSLTNTTVTNLIASVTVDSSGTGGYYKVLQSTDLVYGQVRAYKGFAITFGAGTVYQGQVILQGYYKEV